MQAVSANADVDVIDIIGSIGLEGRHVRLDVHAAAERSRAPCRQDAAGTGDLDLDLVLSLSPRDHAGDRCGNALGDHGRANAEEGHGAVLEHADRGG